MSSVISYNTKMDIMQWGHNKEGAWIWRGTLQGTKEGNHPRQKGRACARTQGAEWMCHSLVATGGAQLDNRCGWGWGQDWSGRPGSLEALSVAKEFGFHPIGNKKPLRVSKGQSCNAKFTSQRSLRLSCGTRTQGARWLMRAPAVLQVRED